MGQTGEIRVVTSAQASAATAQTAGMERLAAIAGDTVDASRIWMGRVTGFPGMNSGPHHHGEAESAIYVVSGSARFYHGEGYAQFKDVSPGDFIFIPPYLPHIEANLSRDEPVVFILARSPDNIVVNLEE